jgi:hypothetical protein
MIWSSDMSLRSSVPPSRTRVAEREQRLVRVVADGGHRVAAMGLALLATDEVGEGAERGRIAERRGAALRSVK